MTARVILCGLGRIGWRGFESNGALATHGSTLMQMSGSKLNLVAAVDTDAAAREAFQIDTGRHVYESLDIALHIEQPQIVVIATPPETHHDLTLCAAAFDSVRGIICEKPMAPTIAECRSMIDACSDKVLLIAHQRRYEQRHRLLRAFIKSEVLGRPMGALGWFEGGHLNNGTHAADTLRFLVGDTPSRIVESEGFGVRIACQRGTVELKSGGDLEPGYLHAMYGNLLECIDTHQTPECSGDDGLEAVRMALDSQRVAENAAA